MTRRDSTMESRKLNEPAARDLFEVDMARPFGLLLEPTMSALPPQTSNVIFNPPNTTPIDYNFALPFSLPISPPSQPPAPLTPAFVRPIPPRIDVTDTHYLQTKGAFTLPSVDFQNSLLKAFVEFVYPYVPVIDLVDFLKIVYHRDGSQGQTSLVLYQAVMFAGSGFVSMDVLRRNGYSTRKEARRALLQRARLLYDFDMESNRFILIQALLLMTYWYEGPDDQKDAWHWLGIAISLARCLGIHRDPGTKVNPSTRKLWKRIWWSALMRDRLLTLGLRRPTRISEQDFDLPMLEEDDFEIGVIDKYSSGILANCELMRDVELQRELAQLCIAKVKLCVCAGHILQAQYALKVRETIKSEGTAESTMMIFPSQTLKTEDINRGDEELGEWLASLPPCCQPRPIDAPGHNDGKASVEVQRALLHMTYNATILALHRSRFSPNAPAKSSSDSVAELSTQKTREAAMRIVQLASELSQLNLERFLPGSGVTALLPTAIVYLQQMKHPDREIRDNAHHAFRQCRHSIEKLREFYVTADFAAMLLDAGLKKFSLVPDEKMSKSSAVQMPTPEESAEKADSGFDIVKESGQYESSTSVLPETRPLSVLDLLPCSPPPVDFASTDVSMVEGADHANPEVELDLSTMDLDMLGDIAQLDSNALFGTNIDGDWWVEPPQIET
ncbi:hypothetical protein jhhlp_003027 [Lomentospora prolificans]|uniref:Xylanolytic transcriptional activator regulatory domain-containing protein n=1 Tax=Lomentospora prolificans TaxID=41688 RepID=A0A2N3NFS1_9PEZI|nr:hypothetical protein jhhlp_003027 [Lomentospora prolificans]